MFHGENYMSETETKPVSNFTLLLIGVTAGIIASSFPRLLPYLSEAEETVTISLFTVKFIYSAIAFSAIIGISMIWLYMGTKEQTRNLFMSALALPAVLSGGINMSTLTSVSENTINDLNKQTIELQEKLEKQNKIEIKTLNLSTIQPITLGATSSFFGISSAYAGDQDPISRRTDNSSIRINADSLERNFVIMLGSSDNQEEINKELNRIDAFGIPSVKAYEIDNKYYLLQNEKKTRSKALLDAISIQKRYGLNPTLIQAK
jgi:hypothetical protein